MAQLSPDLQHRLKLMIGGIPGEIRKSLAPGELEDRVAMATGLLAESARSPARAKVLGERAHRVLTARPRAETEQIVVAKMAKAKVIGDPIQAQALEQQARDELARHPPAVRRPGTARPVAKGSAKPEPGPAGLVMLYDQHGTPIGVCEASKIQPVADPSTTVGKARGATAPRRRPGAR